MKRFGRAIAISLLFSVSAQAVTVISDLDDTIKITSVKSVKGIKKSLLSTDTFLGMPELMRAFKSSKENKLYIVSGSFSIVHGAVAKLLSYNDIPADHVYLVGGTSKKPAELDRLITAADDEVILLGDDQESDPKFYQALQTKYGSKIKAVYIHQLNDDVVLPANQTGFLSAYEVAVHEANAGRLTSENLEAVKTNIENNLDFKKNDLFYSRKVTRRLIPHWQECTSESLERVLAPTRLMPQADLEFLSRIESIAIQNCDD